MITTNGKLKETGIVYKANNYDNLLACMLDAEWFNANAASIFTELFPRLSGNKPGEHRLMLPGHICNSILNCYKTNKRPPTYNEITRDLQALQEADIPLDVAANRVQAVFDLHNSNALRDWKLDEVHRFALQRHNAFLAECIEDAVALGEDPRITRERMLTYFHTQSAAMQPKLQWMNAKDVMIEDDPVDWVVTDLIETNDAFILYGESGIGKTWFMLQLCVHIVLGKKFLHYDCQEAMIFWIDQENRLKRFKRRLRAIIKHLATQLKVDAHELAEIIENKFQFVCMPKPAVSANNPESIKLIAECVNQFAGKKMIVFDNLGSISNVKTMNDSGMKDVLQGILDLADSTGAAVGVIHHKPKGNDTMYGSMYIKASIDNAIEMSSMASKSKPDGSKFGEHVSMISSGKTRDEERNSFLVELIIDEWVNREAVNPRFALLDDVPAEKTKSAINSVKEDKTAQVHQWLYEYREELLGKSKKQAAIRLYELTGRYMNGWKKELDKLITSDVLKQTGASVHSPNNVLEKGSKYADYFNLT